MSTKEEYSVKLALILKTSTLVPKDNFQLTFEDSYLTLQSGTQNINFPYSSMKPIDVPRNASARRVEIDLNSEKYSWMALTFDKPEQLKRACEIVTQHVAKRTPKKVLSKHCTKTQLNQPSRAPLAKSSASVPCTPSYSANGYSNMLQSNKSPRPLPLRVNSTQNNAATVENLRNQWETGRYAQSTQSTRQNSPSNVNISTRKRIFIPVVEDAAEPADSGRVKLLEEKECETKKARNEVVTLDEDLPSSNEADCEESDDKEKESDTRAASRRHVTTPAMNVTSCWKQRRFGPSSFCFRSMTNLGNSCYMNASLQALASLPLFITELFKAVPKTQNNRTPLLKSVVDVYRHIFSPPMLQLDRSKRKVLKSRYQGETGAVPRKVLGDVREAAGEQIDEDMATTTQQDAQEFVGRLLDIIHDEIDGRSAAPEHGSPSSDKENQGFVGKRHEQSPVTSKPSEKSMDLRNLQMPWKMDMLSLQEQSHGPTNPGKLFKVGCYNRLLCNSCGYVEKKEESAYEVQLGLHDGKHTISALLEAQFELHGVDWKCQRPDCKDVTTVTTASTSFHNVPEYLVIVLKRYGYDMSGGTKSNNKISIDPHLYLEELCDGSAKKNAELEKQFHLSHERHLEPEIEVVSDSALNTPVKASMSSSEKVPKGFSPAKSAQRVRHPSHENNEPASTGSLSSKDIFLSEDEPDKEQENIIREVENVHHPFDSTTNKQTTPPPQVSDNEEEPEENIIVSKEYRCTEGPSYTLSAIVNHQGASLTHGHYTAYSFDLDRKVWFKCDDSSITEVSLDNVLDQSQSTCYLLMYRRRHPGDEAEFSIIS